MKITKIQDFHADGGWRTLSFLKITTDDQIVGWSEFSEGRSTPGLTEVIRALGKHIVGDNPCNTSRLNAKLYGMARTTSGGLMFQAVAAIENACLDIKAKSLGVRVSDLFGGSQRDRLPLYWSQCGTLRVRYPDLFASPAVRTLEDLSDLGREAAQRGFRALKTNILLFGPEGAFNYQAGFGSGAGHPALNVDPPLLRAIEASIGAFRKGAGPDMDLLLDLNCNVKPEGARQIAKMLEPYRLMWIEYDLHDPKSLASIRYSTTIPMAALETVYGRRGLRPYLEQNSVDVVIIDPQWNGMSEAVLMAAMADSFEVNVAIHNYYGHLSTLIGAHFASVIPNLRITEYVVDEAPWVKSFFTHPLQIDGGTLVLPDRAGWGTDIDEAAVHARPAKQVF
jgi:galactonate dehydratase